MHPNTVCVLLCFTLHTNVKGKDHSIPAQMGCTGTWSHRGRKTPRVIVLWHANVHTSNCTQRSSLLLLHQRHCGHHSGRHERSKQNRVDIWQDWPKPSWLARITKGKVCLHSWTVVQPSSIIILQRTKDYCPGDDLNSQKRKNRSAILAASCKQCERCTMFVISPPHCSSLTSFCHTVTTGSAKASQSWSHSIGMHADSRAPTPSYAPASQTPSSHLACAQDQYSLQSTAVRGGAAKGWTQTTAGAATMLPLSSYRYLGLVQKLY